MMRVLYVIMEKQFPLKINATIEEKYYLSPKHIWVGWFVVITAVDA